MADTNKNDKEKDKLKNNKTFSKDFKAELKRVTWPTPKQLLTNTVGVIVISIIVAVIVFVLDIAYESANKYGVNKLKEMIVVSDTDSNTNNEENNGGETLEQEEVDLRTDSENNGETGNTTGNENSNTEETTNNEAANNTTEQ